MRLVDRLNLLKQQGSFQGLSLVEKKRRVAEAIKNQILVEGALTNKELNSALLRVFMPDEADDRWNRDRVHRHYISGGFVSFGIKYVLLQKAIKENYKMNGVKIRELGEHTPGESLYIYYLDEEMLKDYLKQRIRINGKYRERGKNLVLFEFFA